MSTNSLNTINYFELPADNIEELKEFYSSIFNWEFEEGKDTSDYWYIENAGIKGAVLKRRNAEQKPTVYVEVNSLDECVSKAKNAGAEIVLDKQQVSEGYFAILKDPQQNIIGVWEPKS